MRDLVNITKALSDPNRLRLIWSLRDGERCVCQLYELLQLAPSTVSKHLSLLSVAGLVQARKEGRWVHYRLAGEGAPQRVRKALKWVLKAMAEEEIARTDDGRMAKILAMSPEELCAMQSRGEKCCR